MIILMFTIWYKAGGGLLSEVGNIFSGVGSYEGGTYAAFLAIFWNDGCILCGGGNKFW